MDLGADGFATFKRISALGSYFTFDEIALVIGILQDKDADGILTALAGSVSRVIVTQSHSERARPARELVTLARSLGLPAVEADPSLAGALDAARSWAAGAEKRAVLVTGSITLIGEAMTLATEGGWR